jgi:predicted esterase
MLALSLGALHSARVDAVVVAAGALPRALHPTPPFARPPRFVLVHGEDDAFVPFSEADALSRAMARAGAPVELVSLHTGHRFRGALGAAFRREVKEALASMGACDESPARL